MPWEKFFRIDPLRNGASNYRIPSDNPFVGNAQMLDEVYSQGHRNPHHLAFLPNGSLLATEAGHDNIEEINLIEAGANYGWSEREGAYVHFASGTLVDGIATLPTDDANNLFTYPVVQVGHTGSQGDKFVGQSLGGGYTSNNGSLLDGEFFYVDFVNSGRLYHSSVSSILASQTLGEPSELTMAQTFEASVVFDHDGNADTAAIANSLPSVLQSTGSYDGSGRVDVRIGQGPLGEMYLLNKRNNMIYLVRNSYPPGSAIPATPAPVAAPEIGRTTTQISFDITVPAYMSNELQIRLVWGDKNLTAAWVVDETWTISDEFPVDTENLLQVFFNDRNGDITLGSVETVLRTGTDASQAIAISAVQFDTGRWDDDSDGVSNFDESADGTDPLVSDVVEPITFTELQDVVLQRCDGCHDNSPSGGLNLLRSVAYDNLVNQESSRKPGAILVIPFDSDNSYLVQKMEGAEGIVGRSMGYGAANFPDLVREWIAAGALNN